MKRGRVVGLGNRDNLIEAALIEPKLQRGPSHFSRITFAPMGLREVIDNFGRAVQRPQSPESDELSRGFFFHGPTSKAMAFPMRDDAVQGCFSNIAIFRPAIFDVTHYIRIG